MKTAEEIYEKAKALPNEGQIEALHYLNFLLSQQEARRQSAEWAAFAASELTKQYVAADAIYDKD